LIYNELSRTYGEWYIETYMDTLDTLPKFNSLPLKSYRAPNRKRIVFQPPFFRGELLNFWGGGSGFYGKLAVVKTENMSFGCTKPTNPPPFTSAGMIGCLGNTCFL